LGLTTVFLYFCLELVFSKNPMFFQAL
jgi:hypothetical protein